MRTSLSTIHYALIRLGYLFIYLCGITNSFARILELVVLTMNKYVRTVFLLAANRLVKGTLTVFPSKCITNFNQISRTSAKKK